VHCERTGPNVLTLRHPVVEAGWSQRYLLIADVHFDNPLCDRRLLTRHLDEAKRDGAGVMCFGDWFDVMGGRSDPRRSKTGTANQHNVDSYLDAVVDESAEFLSPYQGQLLMMADGNHETAIRKNVEVDLLEHLTRALQVQHMGYCGWVRVLFERKGTRGHRTQRRIWYHHGAGGGGEVTKGVIGTARRAVYLPDADVVVTGHIHEAWQLELMRYRLSDGGVERKDSQLHIQLPTYKDESMVGGGYHIEKGRPPKPLGGWWLEFHHDSARPGEVGLSVQRAN